MPRSEAVRGVEIDRDGACFVVAVVFEDGRRETKCRGKHKPTARKWQADLMATHSCPGWSTWAVLKDASDRERRAGVVDLLFGMSEPL